MRERGLLYTAADAAGIVFFTSIDVPSGGGAGRENAGDKAASCGTLDSFLSCLSYPYTERNRAGSF